MIGGYRTKRRIRKTIAIIMVIGLLSTVVSAMTSTPKKLGDAGEVTLLDEGFEDGIMPPEGWTVESAEPEYTWQICSPGIFGEYCACCPAAAPPYDQDEWLISPEIDLRFVEDISIEFWVNGIQYADDWTVYLYVLVDGEVVEELWDYLNWDPWELPANVTRSLDEYSGEIIQLAWRSVGLSSRDFYLDEITVSAEKYNYPAELDVEASIIGMGQIDVEVKNAAKNESAIAENVQWVITVNGNSLFRYINESADGTIPEIAPESSAFISIGDIYGLSLVNVTITVTCDDPRVEPIDKSCRALVFFIFILILEEGDDAKERIGYRNIRSNDRINGQS